MPAHNLCTCAGEHAQVCYSGGCRGCGFTGPQCQAYNGVCSHKRCSTVHPSLLSFEPSLPRDTTISFRGPHIHVTPCIPGSPHIHMLVRTAFIQHAHQHPRSTLTDLPPVKSFMATLSHLYNKYTNACTNTFTQTPTAHRCQPQCPATTASRPDLFLHHTPHRQTCVHKHTHTRAHTHIHTHMHTNTYTHTHTHTRICTHSYTHTHTHIRTHTYTYTHTHTPKYTHTPPRQSWCPLRPP